MKDAPTAKAPSAGPAGPLQGLRVLELGGIGPIPMCAMMLADQGATVLRLERPETRELGVPKPLKYDLLLRGRHRLAVDLKSAAGVDLALYLVGQADILIEGFRPGVVERMGLGPDVCLAANPSLVYGRMTGWGQSGPLANAAGHDANYIALTGALHAIGRSGCAPVPPLNLVGDFGGGAMFLAFGVLAALHSARSSGLGQVVDASMVDGASSLMTAFFGLHAAGIYSSERGTNVLDSGAPYYDVYRCSDGSWLAIAAIEPRFRAALYRGLGLDSAPLDEDRARWPMLRREISTRIASKTRAEWESVFEGVDACVTPVLSMAEAPHHPHNLYRGSFIEIDGVVQPAPAPRFSRTPSSVPHPPGPPNADIPAALRAWGVSSELLAYWTSSGAILNQVAAS